MSCRCTRSFTSLGFFNPQEFDYFCGNNLCARGCVTVYTLTTVSAFEVLTPLPPTPSLETWCGIPQSWNYNVCAVFLLDATFITDPAKFVSGALLSLSAMVQLELPHLNVLTKCDLADRSEVRRTPTTARVEESWHCFERATRFTYDIQIC